MLLNILLLAITMCGLGMGFCAAYGNMMLVAHFAICLIINVFSINVVINRHLSIPPSGK
jgi:hypothetical protein